MFCRLFWRRRGIKNGMQPFWPCPVAVSAVLPASRSAVRRISNRLCRGCGCGCVCRVLCRFPGASPRLSRPVSCSLRYGGRSPQVSARFAFRGRARTSFPCRIRSRYRADDKPIVEFCITNTYYFDDFINKKNCKSAKMLEKGEKRCAYILYFRKIAYLCSPFWTMEIDFLTIKGQFKKCQLFNS